MTIDRSYNSIGCNTSKCYSCNFRFVCASSPYCVIQNINANKDNNTQEVIKEISVILKSQMDAIALVFDKINSINTEVSSIEESISTLNKSINNASNVAEVGIQPETVSYSEVQSNSIPENQIVPFNSEEQKVMVEKKGLFGRTKWVEEKRK